MERRWWVLAIGMVLLFPKVLLPATQAASSVSATGTKEAAKVEIDEEAMRAMVRPLLDNYVKNHPNVQVRIWSLIVLNHLSDVEKEQLFSLPTIVQQMGSKDENVRLIAMDTLRQSLDLDEEEWQGILTPVLRNVAKTSKYKEARTIAIKTMGLLSELDEKEMSTIPLLLELAQDDDAEIRRVALETLSGILAKKESSGGGR